MQEPGTRNTLLPQWRPGTEPAKPWRCCRTHSGDCSLTNEDSGPGQRLPGPDARSLAVTGAYLRTPIPGWHGIAPHRVPRLAYLDDPHFVSSSLQRLRRRKQCSSSCVNNPHLFHVVHLISSHRRHTLLLMLIISTLLKSGEVTATTEKRSARPERVLLWERYVLQISDNTKSDTGKRLLILKSV